MLKIELIEETNYKQPHTLPRCRHCNQEIDINNPYLRITLYSAASKFRIFFHTDCARIFAENIMQATEPPEIEDDYEITEDQAGDPEGNN